MTVEDRFKSSMEEINQELKLLRQHYSMLEEQLGELEVEQRPCVDATAYCCSCRLLFQLHRVSQYLVGNRKVGRSTKRRR